MSEFFKALFWAVVGVLLDKYYDRVLYPACIDYLRNRNAKEKEKLYFGKETREYISRYYSNSVHGHLANCRIGSTSVLLPFLIDNGWDQLDVDLLVNNQTLQLVRTEKCNYPIRKRTIKYRKMIGQTLFDDESLFLHNIAQHNNRIVIEVGGYSYFRRLSFFSDFEKETYSCSINPENKSPLRDKYLPNAYVGAHGAHNTIPIGCDVALLIRPAQEYLVAIHYRSGKTANYPNTAMLVPSFGFGDIANVQENPLLYSFVKEYCEELFDRAELVQRDMHSSPEWFFDAYEEAKDIHSLIQNRKFSFTLLGCGFDTIGGYFNLSLLALIDDTDVSKKILMQSKGNWETNKDKEGAIRFLPIFSSEVEKLLGENKLSPSSAFTLARVVERMQGLTTP